jgi:hypothetical protein
MNPVEEVLEKFFSQINDLTVELGDEQVLSALEVYLPGFDKNISTPRGAVEPLMEKQRWWSRAAESVKDFFKKKGVPGGPGGPGQAAKGIPLGAGAGAFFGKEWDQDVNIDDITTDKALNVKSDSLEQMLIDTNDAIRKMTQVLSQTQQQLSGKLDSIDMSVDDSIAAGSDDPHETAAQVQVRQQTGLKRPPTRKTDKKDSDKEKKSPEKETKVSA